MTQPVLTHHERARAPRESVLVIPGKPVPWKRTRGQGNARFKDPDYRAWSDGARLTFHNALMRGEVCCIDKGAIAVEIIVRWAARLDPRTGKRLGGAAPDIDNHGKAVLDALNGLAWSDDRLIKRLVIDMVDVSSPSQAGVTVTWRSR